MRLFVFITLLSLVPATAAPVPSGIQTFLKNHCYDCHDSTMEKGDLDLEGTTFKLVDEGNAALWAMVHDRVSKGEMPPKKKAQPEADEKSSFLQELNGLLAQHEIARRAANGRALIRRMNRSEYQATLQDLLALPHLDIVDALPPEGNAYGYDKSAEALDFSHVHAKRLLEVSDMALRKAIAPQPTMPKSRTVRFEVKGPENLRRNCAGIYSLLKQGRGMPISGMEVDQTVTRDNGNFQKRDFGSATDEPPYFDSFAMFINAESNLGMAIRPFQIPVAGYYKIRVNGFCVYNEFGELKPTERMGTVGFYSVDRKIGHVDLPPYEPTTAEITVWLEPDDVIKPLVDSAPYQKIRIGGLGKEAFRDFKAHGVAFRWFELEGPLNESWPPESHKRLFGDLPVVVDVNKSRRRGQPDTIVVSDVVSQDPEEDARKLIREFLGQALRRPVTGADMQLPISVIFPKLRKGESFMESMLSGYRAILTSPDFLLMHGDPGTLGDHALAERLSYFLWNSLPDKRLRSMAYQGKLTSDPELLERETNRLLKDPKSDRFIEHFLDKWLKLEEIALTEPDTNLYPDYTPLLMQSAMKESHAYFREMLDHDLGARHVVDSDFVMINQRLARLYDLPGITGSQLRKVSLPKQSVRGGFLTQASVLKTIANGTVTSPVVRGTYVMTQLLGDPPPPPPPAVPAVEPDISGATTIREQLAKHREVESCAACHAKIDPPGFALEGFDVMGGYRDRYRSLKQGDRIELYIDGRRAPTKVAMTVDDSGEMPGGEKFSGIHDFRKILLSKEEQIARNLLEQLIIYSTGAPIGFADRPVVNDMMKRLKEKNYGVKAMIHEIVQSDLFRIK